MTKGWKEFFRYLKETDKYTIATAAIKNFCKIKGTEYFSPNPESFCKQISIDSTILWLNDYGYVYAFEPKKAIEFSKSKWFNYKMNIKYDC